MDYLNKGIKKKPNPADRYAYKIQDKISTVKQRFFYTVSEQGMKKKRSVKKEVLSEILRRIVDCAKPEKIILFGSAAREDMGPDSDLDLLVIKSGDYNPRTVAADIYMKLYGVGQAIDLVVVTPEQVREYSHSPYLVLYPALHEGKVLYNVRPSSTG
jgi:predicted nucleotidyltransferase